MAEIFGETDSFLPFFGGKPQFRHVQQELTQPVIIAVQVIEAMKASPSSIILVFRSVIVSVTMSLVMSS